MISPALIEWQKLDTTCGFIFPWFTHPFLDVLKTWDLSEKNILEFGAGRSTAWWRFHSFWVDSVETNPDWAKAVANEVVGYDNGRILYYSDPLAYEDGKEQKYFDLIRGDMKYDVIVVDGIYRTECLQWALDHFNGRPGIIIADNWQQDYVWLSEKAEEIMAPYKINKFIQKNHTNHEGHPWQTVYWNIP